MSSQTPEFLQFNKKKTRKEQNHLKPSWDLARPTLNVMVAMAMSKMDTKMTYHKFHSE